MGTEQRSSQSRPEHLVFVEQWLGDNARSVFLFQKGTSLEDGAVRSTGKRPLNRSSCLPLPLFMEAVAKFRDTRSLGNHFPQEGGFEDEPNRQRLVDVLNTPVWFTFDTMLCENGLRIEGTLFYESDGKGLLSIITGIPVERAYVLVLQVPTKLRLRRHNLVYAAR